VGEKGRWMDGWCAPPQPQMRNVYCCLLALPTKVRILCSHSL
jgi:hypothetical protein